MTTQTWTKASSSSNKTYTIKLLENGTLTCDCQGWTNKRPGKPRECRHTKDVIGENGWTRVVLYDEFVGIADDAEPVQDAFLGLSADGDLVTAADVVVGATDMSAPFPQLALAMTTDAPTGAAFEAAYPNSMYFLDEKIDGYRCVVVKRGSNVQGWSRPRSSGNGALSTAVPGHVIEQVSKMPDCVLDGELWVPGGHSWDVTSARASNPGALVFVVFDVLEVMGQSTLSETQDNRRTMLELLLAHTDNDAAIRLVPTFEVSWAAVEAICARGGEGAIVKRRTASYRPGGRDARWTKVVQARTATMTVTGFVAGKLGPYSTLALSGPVDVKTVKTLNNEVLADIARAPESFIGRRLVIGYTPRGVKAMHPRFDHWASAEE